MTSTQRVLLFAILLAAALHFPSWSDHRKRNWEVMLDMLESIPYGPLDENPNFPDGKTARPPIEGTIARGFAPLVSNGLVLDVECDWKDLEAAQAAAWDALAPPKPADGDLARGAAVFAAICATCHGPSGAGDGAVTKRGVPPPPPLFAEGARGMSDGRLYRIITAGQGNMAPHAAQVARADRWRVVRFVRTLQPE